MARPKDDTPPITPEEYFALCERDAQHRYEYIDGYVRMMAGGTSNHADIAGNCYRQLANALEAQGSPCVAKPDGMALAVTASRYYLPDTMVTCDHDDLAAGKERLMHRPSLIVEVLSETTEATDRLEKLFAYNNLPTVQAYMLIHTDMVKAEVIRRGNDGNLSHSITYAAGDTIELEFLGLSITMDSLYRNTTGIVR